MKSFRRMLAVIAIAGAASLAWVGVSSLVQNVQFARAAQDVEATRTELAKVENMANVFRQVSKVVEPSVVDIQVVKTVKTAARTTTDPNDLLRQFFRDRQNQNGDDNQPQIPDDLRDQLESTPEEELRQVNQGSGVIMEAQDGIGYIVTNYHVARDATSLIITLSDGREIDKAKLIGTDPKSDLALIRVEADRLIPARWGDSDYLEKGDFVLAFGSPFGFVGSMTHGIVSALHRQARIITGQFAYENFIQVDAPINPGNSGGPLVNLRGEVIGINTAIATSTRSFAGVGFAIPSNQARPIVQALKEKGKVTRGWLGVEIGDLTQARVREFAQKSGFKGDSGVFVTSVIHNTPAEGVLKEADVVTAIDGKNVTTVQSLRSIIAVTPPGNDVKLTVVRDGKERQVTLKVGEQPNDLLQVAASRARGGDPDNATSSAESLGLKLVNPTDQQLERYGLAGRTGALVTAVEQGSPAASIGIRPGELITKVGTEDVHNAEEAAAAIAKQDPSKGMALHVTNQRQSRFVFIKSSK
ncbi:MAG: trypsin-like peptidase domain-containing protein [Tepidisphaeraceae bacterium]